MMRATGEETLRKTGTTTVGLVGKDAVILGSERRATMGHLIAHKDTRKIYRIDQNLGLTTAGLVGDAQLLVKYMRAEIELRRLKTGREVSVRAAANLLGNILHGARYAPYYVGLILGGMDRSGPGVWSLDAAGGAIPDDFISVGSGSPFAYGVLEDRYRKEMSAGDAIDVALLSLRAAQARDSASGDGYAIAVIDSGGYRELGGEEITTHLDKAGVLSQASQRRAR
jgi:proteasome beta subunit